MTQHRIKDKMVKANRRSYKGQGFHQKVETSQQGASSSTYHHGELAVAANLGKLRSPPEAGTHQV